MDVLRSIGKQSGEFVESVPKNKKKKRQRRQKKKTKKAITVVRMCRKGRFKPGVKERGSGE